MRPYARDQSSRSREGVTQFTFLEFLLVSALRLRRNVLRPGIILVLTTNGRMRQVRTVRFLIFRWPPGSPGCRNRFAGAAGITWSHRGRGWSNREAGSPLTGRKDQGNAPADAAGNRAEKHGDAATRNGRESHPVV